MADITTTRDGAGAVTTRTPDVPMPRAAGINMNDLIGMLVQKRLSEAKAPEAAAPPQAVGLLAPAARAATARSVAPAPSPRTPTVRTPQREKTLSRRVLDPQRSPYADMSTSWTGGLPPTGDTRQYVMERYLGNGDFEFDSVRPKGSSGGFSGGGAQSSLHASANLGGPGPASGILASRDDFDPVAQAVRARPRR